MKGTIAEITKAFGLIEGDLRRGLGSLDVGRFSETAATRLQRSLLRSIDGLNRYAARWTRAAIGAKYAESQARARTRLELIGAERNKAHDRRRHGRAIAESATEALKDFMKATNSMKVFVGRYIEALRRHSQSVAQIQEFDESVLGELGDEYVANLVTEAIAENKTRTYISRSIMDWLRKNLADGNYIQIGSRMFNIRSYAELVARTRMIEAATEAVKEMCAEHENDLVQFSKHDNPCDECAKLEGKIFSISGRSMKYPPLTADNEPPIHCRCEHNLVPTSEIALRWREAYA